MFPWWRIKRLEMSSKKQTNNTKLLNTAVEMRSFVTAEKAKSQKRFFFSGIQGQFYTNIKPGALKEYIA